MYKRILAGLLLLVAAGGHAWASEVISGFDSEKDLPVLNEELRKQDAEADALDNRITVLEASPGVSAATQAELETGSITTAYTSPGRQQFHPSAAKAWINLDGTGTIANRGSYGVASITDNGGGDYTVTFSTAFSSTNSMCPVVSLSVNGDTTFNPREAEVLVASTTTVRILTGSESGGQEDMDYVYLAVFGDQ